MPWASRAIATDTDLPTDSEDSEDDDTSPQDADDAQEPIADDSDTNEPTYYIPEYLVDTILESLADGTYTLAEMPSDIKIDFLQYVRDNPSKLDILPADVRAEVEGEINNL